MIPCSRPAISGRAHKGNSYKKKLSALYPDLFGWDPAELPRAYMAIEEWDKAISALQRCMTTPRRRVTLAPILIECFAIQGQFEKAGQSLEALARANPERNYDHIRLSLAMRGRDFDGALGYLEEICAGPGQKNPPYAYFSEVGYVHWLKDDLDKAEKAYRTVVDPENLKEEWQRSTDMAALALSQGKIGQALDLAQKRLALTKNIKDFALSGRERDIHYELAINYRLAGRMADALR